MMKKNLSFALVVLILVATAVLVINAGKTKKRPARPTTAKIAESHMACLLNCKASLPRDSIPLVCFSQCANNNSSATTKEQDSQREKIQIFSDSSAEFPATAENVWPLYYNELVRMLTRGAEPSKLFAGLQLVHAPLYADWIGDAALFQRFVKQTTPFQESFEPSALLGTFDNNYCNFIHSLDVPFVDMNLPAVKQANDRVDETLKELDKQESICQNKFMMLPYSVSGTSSFDDYALRNCPAFILAKHDSERASIQAKAINEQIAGSFKNSLALQAKHKCLQPYERKFVELTPLSKFIQDVNSGAYNRLSMSMMKHSYTHLDYSSFSKTKFMTPIVSYKNEKSLKFAATTIRDFQLNVTALSFAAIHVTPDHSWFIGDVLGMWKNGPFKAGYNTNSFFGPTGSVPMMPRTYFIAFQPTVEFFLSQQDATEWEQESAKHFGINLQVLSFNFDTKRRVKTSFVKENMWRVTISDTSTIPQIFAVNNIVF